MNKVRCAIYTRKSSEEGLEQDFNSLHAQREACSAYVLSQASEGWSALPEVYDDGGISGGTLERPALKRLLGDIDAGRIDIVVVYKVDRLTRALLDFSKLVEAFDKAGVSFVSITQSFNTTTSMGRLTLNMLLSFAQFEREVTAERIRDKIAASKAKGMWMGGVCPLGYRPDGRTLAIVPEHADVVRDLFRHYLDVGNVRLLADQLEQAGKRAPARLAASGKKLGGGTFKRGQLYSMLSNPTYVGEVHHKGSVYVGQHQPIVERDLWSRVQEALAANRQGTQRGKSTPTVSVLAGLVFGDDGNPLVATHACKGKQRYRYYVSKALLNGSAGQGIRMSAPELEKAVNEEVAKAFDQPVLIADLAGLPIQADTFRLLVPACAEVAQTLRRRTPLLLRNLVSKVEVTAACITVEISTASIASCLNAQLRQGAPEHVYLHVRAQLRRSGKVVRLIEADRHSPLNPVPQAHLVRLIALGSRWWREMIQGGITVSELAERHNVDKSYVTRVVRANFLAPKVVEQILAGAHPASLDAKRLLALNNLPLEWQAQERELLMH
ncbi:MAG: recombinase family protein [Burkholderiaceae bacterium]